MSELAPVEELAEMKEPKDGIGHPEEHGDAELEGCYVLRVSGPVEGADRDGDAEEGDSDEQEPGTAEFQSADGRQEGVEASGALVTQGALLEEVHYAHDGEKSEHPVTENGDGGV